MTRIGFVTTRLSLELTDGHGALQRKTKPNRVSVADLTDAVGTTVVVVKRPMRGGIERRHVIDHEAVQVPPARQLQCQVPPAIEAFLHRVRRWVPACRRSQIQRHMMGLRRAELKRRGPRNSSM